MKSRRHYLGDQRAMSASQGSMRRLCALALVLTWLGVGLPNICSAGSNPDNEIMRYGFLSTLFSKVNLKDAEIAVEIWLNEVWGTKTKARVFNDPNSLQEAIKAKEVDLVGLPVLDYFHIKDQAMLEPILCAEVGGTFGVEYHLVIRADAPYDTISGLKGKNLILQKVDEVNLIPIMWLTAELKKQGQPGADQFFASLKKVDKPSQAMLPVLFRQADACLVSQNGYNLMKELNPQIGKELKVVAKSPPLVTGMLAVRKDVSASLKQRVVEKATNLLKYPRGKQILVLFQINGFYLFNPGYFDNVIALLDVKKSSGEMKRAAR